MAESFSFNVCRNCLSPEVIYCCDGPCRTAICRTCLVKEAFGFKPPAEKSFYELMDKCTPFKCAACFAKKLSCWACFTDKPNSPMLQCSEYGCSSAIHKECYVKVFKVPCPSTLICGIHKCTQCRKGYKSTETINTCIGCLTSWHKNCLVESRTSVLHLCTNNSSDPEFNALLCDPCILRAKLANDPATLVQHKKAISYGFVALRKSLMTNPSADAYCLPFFRFVYPVYGVMWLMNFYVSNKQLSMLNKVPDLPSFRFAWPDKKLILKHVNIICSFTLDPGILCKFKDCSSSLAKEREQRGPFTAKVPQSAHMPLVRLQTPITNSTSGGIRTEALAPSSAAVASSPTTHEVLQRLHLTRPAAAAVVPSSSFPAVPSTAAPVARSIQEAPRPIVSDPIKKVDIGIQSPPRQLLLSRAAAPIQSSAPAPTAQNSAVSRPLNQTIPHSSTQIESAVQARAGPAEQHASTKAIAPPPAQEPETKSVPTPLSQVLTEMYQSLIHQTCQYIDTVEKEKEQTRNQKIEALNRAINELKLYSSETQAMRFGCVTTHSKYDGSVGRLLIVTRTSIPIVFTANPSSEHNYLLLSYIPLSTEL